MRVKRKRDPSRKANRTLHRSALRGIRLARSRLRRHDYLRDASADSPLLVTESRDGKGI